MAPAPPPRAPRVISPQLVRRVESQAVWSPSHFVLMSASGVLAAVSFLANSVPLLLGAMIVAPALQPLALTAVGLVLRDVRLARRGAVLSVAGLLVAVAAALLTTWLLNATGVVPEAMNLVRRPLLDERVRPGWYSVVAAVAAGIAGGIAVVQRKMDTLVGTVAAIALVPAAAAAGIALLSGDPVRATGGLVLLGVNVLVVTGAIVLVLAVARPVDRDPGEDEQSG